MPHMDSLAKDDVVFTQAYTSGHFSSPTRAGLMLGRYQHRVGVYSAGKETAYTVVMRGEKIGKAIRTGPWRYARWPGGDELYNLENDPTEQKNLARSGKHESLIKEMRGHLNSIDTRAKSKRRK